MPHEADPTLSPKNTISDTREYKLLLLEEISRNENLRNISSSSIQKLLENSQNISTPVVSGNPSLDGGDSTLRIELKQSPDHCTPLLQVRHGSSLEGHSPAR